jgi:pyruvate/2-oxoacid:ferredoxin oxidoreductase beta subunit
MITVMVLAAAASAVISCTGCRFVVVAAFALKEAKDNATAANAMKNFFMINLYYCYNYYDFTANSLFDNKCHVIIYFLPFISISQK